MTKEEAIKYLQQLYPNGGHCWLDEQRIEAIGMAVKSLQEEPVSDLEQEIIRYIGYPQEVDEGVSTTMIRKAARHFAEWGMNHQEFVSEDLEDAATKYAQDKYLSVQTSQAFKNGAQWQKQQMLKDAINAHVFTNGMGNKYLFPDYNENIKVDGKVKIIIIEED